jgi:hypothetical protein
MQKMCQNLTVTVIMNMKTIDGVIMTIYMNMRKLHRFFVLIIIALGLLMAITGIMIKYMLFDAGMARYIHNNISVIFTAVLIIMTCSGAFMYSYPIYTRRKQKNAEKSES